MSETKFVVCPGKVKSVNDGDWHYVGVAALVRLYELRPDEYVVAGRARGHQGLVPLYPRRDGNYGRPA